MRRTSNRDARRGHAVTVAEAWANGRHCAESGVMSAGASPRSAYAYAIGR